MWSLQTSKSKVGHSRVPNCKKVTQTTQKVLKKRCFTLCDFLLEEGISFGRTIRVGEVSRMHIYILLDTSGSIKKKDFNLSREATIALIKKVTPQSHSFFPFPSFSF